MNSEKDTRFLPVLPLKNVVALPKSIMPVIVGRDLSVAAVEAALADTKEIFVTAQTSTEVAVPTPDDLYENGTRAVILQANRMPNGSLKILIEGISRSRIVEVTRTDEFIGVVAEDIKVPEPKKTADNVALWRTFFDLFKSYVKLSDKVPADLPSMFKGAMDFDYLADTVAVHIQISLDERQQLLEMVDPIERMQHLLTLLKREIEIIRTENKIRKRVQNQVEKQQKDYYLNEQMRAIQSELGRDGLGKEIEEMRKKAKDARMSKEAFNKVESELSRLEQMQPTSPEAAVSRNYVDWLVSLPWHKRSRDTVSLKKAEQLLDDSHASMQKAKERIVEFIATKKFAGKNLKRSPIICLIGPPGVGKTSLSRSIAESLNREFIRISLGGMRDEAEIRGHRRTYVGAMPGKIIQSMRKAKTINPVILLDEIDKMSLDFRGDPASALLEVLDTELNNAFADYFLEVDYDISQVMFITTANSYDTIPYPLLDRMDIINLSGYTLNEKAEIAKKYLLPKIVKEYTLDPKAMVLSDEILELVIDEYTKEAGVRSLDRVLAKLARKCIQELLADAKKKSVTITKELLEKWLGSPKFKKQDKELAQEVGLATGLAWTEMGGDLLDIEITILKGKGSLALTGQLGEVMRESAEAALTYVRSRAKELGLKEEFYSDVDIHIHVPEGAIPKDGPSAGITMSTALVSALTKVPINRALAMTGEVTLRGRVLPVGGLKEKLLAATRFGITKVVVPHENESDIKEFQKELDKSLEIVYADNMDTVLEHALTESPFKKRPVKKAATKKTVKPAQQAQTSI